MNNGPTFKNVIFLVLNFYETQKVEMVKLYRTKACPGGLWFRYFALMPTSTSISVSRNCARKCIAGIRDMEQKKAVQRR